MNLVGQGASFNPPFDRQPLPKAVSDTIGVVFESGELPDGHIDKKPKRKSHTKRWLIAGGLGLLLIAKCSGNGSGSGEQPSATTLAAQNIVSAISEDSVVLTVPTTRLAPVETTKTAPPPLSLETTTTTVPAPTTTVAPPTTVAPVPAIIGQKFECFNIGLLSEISGKKVTEGASYVYLLLKYSGMPQVQDTAFAELDSRIVQLNGGDPSLHIGQDPLLATNCQPIN